MPVRDVVQDLKGAEELLKRGITGVDLVKALSKSGFKDVAENVLNMLKQRVLKVDGGLRPVSEDEVIKIRNKAAKAIQGLFKELIYQK